MLCMLVITSMASSQVSISALNTPHTENFNTLPTSDATWSDNSTLPNWYHWRTAPGRTLSANAGSSTTGALYSYGTGTSTERALGSIGSGNTTNGGNFTWGIRLKNNTGGMVNTVSVSYYGEQWRNSAAAAQTVSFQYQTGTPVTNADPAIGSWTPVTALDFTSPITGGSAGALNGDAAANRVLISGTISVSLADGDEIMLLWFDPDHSGSDHGLAVDDVSISFILTALPVELAAFRAYSQDHLVHLKWRTATELNNFGFMVQRRTEMGEAWEDVSFVTGHGTRFTPVDYAFTDTPPEHMGPLSYRLRQIDRDGSMEYSPVLTVNISQAADAFTLSVFPNPAVQSALATFTLHDAAYANVALLDMTGRCIMTLLDERLEAGTHNLAIPLQALPSGRYMLLARSGQRTQHTQIVVAK